MTKKRENIYEVKLERFLHLVWKELKKDTKDMLDFLLFYKKPKDKFERLLHVIEVVSIYIIFQFAWKGAFG